MNAAYERINFGKFFEKLRTQQRISTQELAEGLCDASLITKIESGERFASMLLRDRLIERIGVESDEYEKFVKVAEFKYWKKRKNIIAAIKSGDYKVAEEILGTYKNELETEKKTDVLEEQCYLDLTAMMAKIDGKKEASFIAGEALRKTVALDSSGLVISSRLAPREINLAIEYSLGQTVQIRKRQLESLLRYADTSGIADKNRVLFYPKLVYIYVSEFLKENSRNSKWLTDALRMIAKAKDILYNTRRLLFALELTCVAKEVWACVLKLSNSDELTQVFYGYDVRNEEEFQLWNDLGETYGVGMTAIGWCYLYDDEGIKCAGDVIRRRRKMMGLSREKLCSDICSPDTLKRIEKLKVDPHPTNMVQLFKKLNLSSEYQKTLVSLSDPEVRKHEEKVIRYANSNRVDEAIEELSYLKQSLNNPGNEDKQFILMTETMLFFRRGSISSDECYERLKNALKYTLIQYDISGEYYLTRMEHNCIYNIIMNKKGELTEEEKLLVIKLSTAAEDNNLDDDTRLMELFLIASIKAFLRMGNSAMAEVSIKKLITLELQSRRQFLLYQALNENILLFKLKKEQGTESSKVDIELNKKFIMAMNEYKRRQASK